MTEYWRDVIFRAIEQWFSSPIIVNFLKVLLGAVVTMIGGIGGTFFSVIFLMILDVILGATTAVRSGKPFRSKIFRKGLLEKFLLYMLIFISCYIVEDIVKHSIDYQAFYFVGLTATLISFYELSSILEHLATLYPRSHIVKKLAKWLNIWQEKIDDKGKHLFDDLDNNNKNNNI